MSFTDETRRAYCGNEHVRARIRELFGDAVLETGAAILVNLLVTTMVTSVTS